MVTVTAVAAVVTTAVAAVVTTAVGAVVAGPPPQPGTAQGQLQTS